MGLQDRPQPKFEDQGSLEPWAAVALDYGDAEEEENDEQSGSASFGSLMSLSVGKPKKRPVLEVDPEELAKASHQFELLATKILDHTEERPAPVYGKIALDPFDGTEPDPDAEEEEAFEEELAAGTAEEDAGELRPETAARLDAMLGLGAESVTAEYDDESDAALPSLTGASAKKAKKPLFVHSDDDDDEADGAAGYGIPHFEEAAHLQEEQAPADPGGLADGAQPHEPFAGHDGTAQSESASPTGIWDPHVEEFEEVQWPDEPAWPDLYSDEDEVEDEIAPDAPFESFTAAEFVPGAMEPPPEPVAESAEPVPDSASYEIGQEFEAEEAAAVASVALSRMERPATHSSVRARLVREVKPRMSLWHYCWKAVVSLYRLLAGRR